MQDSWGTGFVDCINRNTTDTQRVYENALAYGIEQVIYASSSSVYGSNDDALSNRIPQPISPYGVSKLAGEHLAGVYRERGLSITCLRYFTVFGPRQRPDMAIHRMFEATRPGGSTFVKRGSGEQRREFTFVNDVVEATIIASKTASAANATLDIGGGFSVSLNELATSIQNISELEMRLSSIPQTAGDPYTTVANLNQTCDTIEWHPTTTLEQGLEAQWLWHFPSSDDVLHHVPIAEIVKNTPHTQVRT